jgi:hypothetical protein
MAKPKDDWSFLFQIQGQWAVLIERGLFCLALALVAKFILHVPILEWVMVIAAAVYIVRGIVVGLQFDD